MDAWFIRNTLPGPVSYTHLDVYKRQEQDTKVAGMAHESGKACIIVVNKWDAIEKDGKTMDRMRQDVMRDLSYMTYAPIVFISALTGQRVGRLFELCLLYTSRCV